ncbi:MAG: hypothetical protein ACLRJV_17625 [Eubacteriales bacterium]
MKSPAGWTFFPQMPYQVLERYHEEFGCAYLLITHDRQTAYRISSRILELNQGVFVREAVRTESI